MPDNSSPVDEDSLPHMCSTMISWKVFNNKCATIVPCIGHQCQGAFGHTGEGYPFLSGVGARLHVPMLKGVICVNAGLKQYQTRRNQTPGDAPGQTDLGSDGQGH